MKKSTPLLASLLITALAAVAMTTPSCAGGETAGGGSGATSGSTGGRSGGSTGGSTFFNTGGSTFNNTGGSTFGSTGGATSGSTGGSGFPSNTGGATGTSTGGATVGGTGGATTNPGALTVMGNYVTSGTWMGYGFSGTYGTVATIMPSCTPPACPPTNTQWCASGMVSAEPLNPGSSGAYLGFSIAQAISTTPAGTPTPNIVPGGTGIRVNLSAMVPGGRIQLSDNLMPANTWCYQVQPGGSALPASNMIPWSMFNKTCYSAPVPAGAYTMQPISQVQVVVPSAATASTYSFCLLDVRQY
jgi:hypothetical protein